MSFMQKYEEMLEDGEQNDDYEPACCNCCDCSDCNDCDICNDCSDCCNCCTCGCDCDNVDDDCCHDDCDNCSDCNDCDSCCEELQEDSALAVGTADASDLHVPACILGHSFGLNDAHALTGQAKKHGSCKGDVAYGLTCVLCEGDCCNQCQKPALSQVTDLTNG